MFFPFCDLENGFSPIAVLNISSVSVKSASTLF